MEATEMRQIKFKIDHIVEMVYLRLSENGKLINKSVVETVVKDIIVKILDNNIQNNRIIEECTSNYLQKEKSEGIRVRRNLKTVKS